MHRSATDRAGVRCRRGGVAARAALLLACALGAVGAVGVGGAAGVAGAAGPAGRAGSAGRRYAAELDRQAFPALDAAVTFPPTPAGAQARWLFGALEHLPIAAATLRAHFEPSFLAQVPASALNADFERFVPLTLLSVSSTGAASLVAIVDTDAGFEQALLDVDSHGLISGLLLRPVQNLPTTLPRTPPGRQALWLFTMLDELPATTAALKAHFDAAFLAQAPPSELDQVLEGIGPLKFESVTTSSADSLVLVVETDSLEQLTMTLRLDAHGLIGGLTFEPVVKASTSWAQIDREVSSVAPAVGFLVAKLDGNTCTTVHGIEATTPLPLGSAFKLYVLDALAEAVATGRVHWNELLTVTAAAKSLPSGTLQDDPDGTRLSVQQVAEKMISISDNTAADMLIALLGRNAVEAAARQAGMADPSLDEPFLTTRELFVLKLDHWPQLAERYVALPSPQRLSFLQHVVDPVSLTALAAATSSWSAPRDIDSIEWFASPDDICRVYASLAQLASRPGLAPLRQILSTNGGDLQLKQQQWPSVWFKGGSEPGVLTLNYLATTSGGQRYVVSVLAADDKSAIPSSGTTTLLDAISGAFELAVG